MKELKHLLDYPLLQEWGFIWAGKSGSVVLSYIVQHTESDMFCGGPVSISAIPHPNLGRMWFIHDMTNDERLFSGRIRNKKDLESLLECILVFKPGRDDW